MEEENHPFGENELIFVHFPFRPFFQLHAYGRKSISRFAPMSLHRLFKVRRGGKGPGSTWQYSSNISKQEVRYYKGFPFLTSELDSIHTSISPFSESRSVSNFPARLHTDSNMKSTGNAVNQPGQHVFTLGFRNEPSDVYSEIRQWMCCCLVNTFSQSPLLTKCWCSMLEFLKLRGWMGIPRQYEQCLYNSSWYI